MWVSSTANDWQQDAGILEARGPTALTMTRRNFVQLTYDYKKKSCNKPMIVRRRRIVQLTHDYEEKKKNRGTYDYEKKKNPATNLWLD